MLVSIAFAAVFVILCFAVSLAFESQRGIGTVLLTYLGGISAAMLGGIVFGNKKSKKPKTLKKYNKTKRK